MLSLARASLALLLSLGASSSVSALTVDHENCYITRFTTPECYESYLAANPGRILRALPGIYAALVEVDSEYTEVDLDADPCVTSCYQDVESEIEWGPGLTSRRLSDGDVPVERKSVDERDLSEVTGWNIDMIKAHEVSDSAISNRNVCILSTGFELGHEDLPNNSTGVLTGTSDSITGEWYEDSALNSYGTFNMGILTALAGNGKGVTGIVRNGGLNVHTVKVFKEYGVFWSSDLVTALNECKDAGKANIISFPIVVAKQAGTTDVIDDMYERDGILFIGEAHNDMFPGCDPKVVSVTSVRENLTIADGGTVSSSDISAPGAGDEIISTIKGNTYGHTRGFSASSHVTGVAALIWSRYPTYSNKMIKECLLQGAVDIGPTGYDSMYGHGLVDAKAADMICKEMEDGDDDKFDWDINLTKPAFIVKPALDQGIYHIETCYNISDRNYEVLIHENDCLTDTSDIPILNITENVGDGYNELEVQMLYNQSVIQDGELWTANKTGGNVYFCVSVSLFYGATKVTFHEARYKIEVDSLTDFNTTIDIKYDAPEEYEEEIDYEEDIEAFPCDDSYNEIVPAPVHTQGDYAQICLETVDGSFFAIHSVKDVLVSQDTAYAYPYVTNFVDSRLATSTCINSNSTDATCKVKMQLLAWYFQEADPSDLDMVGTVKLDYIGSGRRMSIEKEVKIVPRNLRAENGGADTGKFSETIAITGDVGDESSAIGSSMSSVGMSMVTMLAFVVGGAMYV